MNIFYQENGEDLIDIGAVIHILLRKAHIIANFPCFSYSIQNAPSITYCE